MALTLNKQVQAPQEPAQEIEKEQAAAAVEAAAGQASEIGSKSDKIALVAVLGDPSREDVTPRTVNGKTETITTATIVGYQFQALEDMEVPKVALGDDARKNPMSFNPSEMNNTIHVKAGEKFNLTRFGTGRLLSLPEFNARVTGGGKEFAVVYQKASNAPKGADGSAAAIGDKFPTVSLRGVTTSIKDCPMINVLTFEKEQVTGQDGKPQNRIVSRTVVKGYEDWEPLCRAAVRRSSTAVGISASKTYNQNAQAFMRLLEKQQRRG